MSNNVNSKYPKGLIALCFMQATTMIGFSFIFSMAILYMTKRLGFSDKESVTLFGAYAAIVYGLPLFGGFLGDKYLGFKFSTAFSTLVCGVGLLFIAIPSKFFFCFGLACYAIATCVQVPNMYCLVGNLYDKNDERRHGGFTLAYVAMNIGAFAASSSSGFLSAHFGYSITFVIGAIAMFSTLIAYFIGNKHFEDGFKTEGNEIKPIVHNLQSRIKGVILYFLAIPVCALGFNYPDTCNNLILLVGVLAALYIVYISFQHEPVQRKKLLVFLGLTIVSLGFGTLYMMAPTVLTLFIERNVDRHFLGFLIPTSSVYSLNPFFIIVAGPVLSYLWLYLTHRKKNPSGAYKLAFGVIMAGIGYAVLVPAISDANTLGLTAFYWIIISYFFQTMGELFVNPVGFALVGSLAPPGREGFLMGFFQLNTGVASVLMAYMAGEANKLEGVTAPLQTNSMYQHAFSHYGLYSFIIGVIALGLAPYFSKLMRK